MRWIRICCWVCSLVQCIGVFCFYQLVVQFVCYLFGLFQWGQVFVVFDDGKVSVRNGVGNFGVQFWWCGLVVVVVYDQCGVVDVFQCWVVVGVVDDGFFLLFEYFGFYFFGYVVYDVCVVFVVEMIGVDEFGQYLVDDDIEIVFGQMYLGVVSFNGFWYVGLC